VSRAPEVNAEVRVTSGAKPERKVDAAAPDPFAVGVRVLRMAPAWLLSMTAGCSLLIILLGWMNPGGMANTVAYAPAFNDARPATTAPAPTPSQPAAPAHPAQTTEPAAAPAGVAPTAESAPAAAAEPAAPAPAAAEQAPAAAEQAPATTPQAEEKTQPATPSQSAETPARSADADGNFTVQVGSFNNSSEANERVSGLRNAGFEARSVAVELPGRGTWYRVQVGRFADRAEASKTAASLRSKGAGAALVVPVQN
ncbi:MAG TPA: SPOR domain-containing protein, partial [Pyrinomonadaceae bacterium]|nr:SPOR domain-containing protein [Pyrinomonadaceae bacterium]